MTSRIAVYRLTALLSVAFFLRSAPAAEESLMVGMAVVDITPPVQQMAGPLKARCVVFRQGNEQAAVVVCVLPESLQSWGDAPTRIEPVTGRIRLAGIENAGSVIAVPLNGVGVATETTFNAVRDGECWSLTLSAPALTYRIETAR